MEELRLALQEERQLLQTAAQDPFLKNLQPMFWGAKKTSEDENG